MGTPVNSSPEVERFDRDLVARKLWVLDEERGRDAANNIGSNRYIWVESQLSALRERLNLIYKVHEEVRNLQRLPKTPELLRQVYLNSILIAIARISTICSLLADDAQRTGRQHDPSLAAQIAELRRVRARLEQHWKDKIEIEAREWEHRNVRPTSKVAELTKSGRRARREAPATAPKPAEVRARSVAKLIKELNELKPMMRAEASYSKLRQKYNAFLAFRICERREDLREKLINIQSSKRHVRLAKELAAAHHGVELSTIETNWKDHKPPAFRRK